MLARTHRPRLGISLGCLFVLLQVGAGAGCSTDEEGSDGEGDTASADPGTEAGTGGSAGDGTGGSGGTAGASGSAGSDAGSTDGGTSGAGAGTAGTDGSADSEGGTGDGGGLAEYRGMHDFHSFSNGVIREHVWTLDPIVYYTWAGDLSQANADRWMGWYRDCNALYERVLGRDAYLENDPNFGPSKVLAVVDADPMMCGTVAAAGCGNKSKAQAARSYATSMATTPSSITPHWVLLYEMGRGGQPETFYERAIWPRDGWNAGMPHTMAGVCFHELVGDEALESTRATPGKLLEKLDAWEASDLEYASVFAEGSSGSGYIAHDLVAAMLYRLLQREGLDALVAFFREIENKPPASNATDAMCDFVNAVNAVTDGRMDETLRGPWGLPDAC